MSTSSEGTLRRALGAGLCFLSLSVGLSCHSRSAAPDSDPEGAERAAADSAEVSAEGFTPRYPQRVCSFDAAVAQDPHTLAPSADGIRRLALVVGVGDYASEQVRDLVGPPNDAERFYDLLTDTTTGFAFPKENVCLLKDSAATVAAFKEAWQKALVDRARDGDVVVFIYTGHGSQARDGNGDETDEKDETFLFHDVRTEGVMDLVDDEMNLMLGRLYDSMSRGSGAPERITVILDSCNSATATYGDEVRFSQPASSQPLDLAAGIGDADSPWLTKGVPGLVTLGAARDGTPAIEKNGEGIFTNAILETLNEAMGTVLTYDQLIAQVSQKVRVNSVQIPDAFGELNVAVFGTDVIRTPPSFTVKEIVGDVIRLAGSPLPGWGSGAEVRVFPPGTAEKDLKDPEKSRGLYVLTTYQSITAEARALVAPASGEGPKVGDLAVLVHPSEEAGGMNVAFRPEGGTGGVPAALKQGILEALASREEYAVIHHEAGMDAWELGIDPYGHLELRDTGGVVRTTYLTVEGEDGAQQIADPQAVARNLWQHARQAALLSISGEAGWDFVNNETLKVRLIESRTKSPCAEGKWIENEPNAPQRVPMCANYHVEVSYDAETAGPGAPRLVVGGLIISSDGGIYGLPDSASARVVLEPGGRAAILNRQPFVALPPLGTVDHLLIAGVQEGNEINWSALSDPSTGRGEAASALDSVLQGLADHQRAARPAETADEKTWTTTHVTLSTVSNAGFAEPESSDAEVSSREYTIPNFDIRPYLPANKNSALYRVLTTADSLARFSAENDGLEYNQDHEGRWEKQDDAYNLQRGIDCSRSIWYAFTRADVKYNDTPHSNKKNTHRDMGTYLATWGMVDEDSAHLDEIAYPSGVTEVGASQMKDQFVSCQDDMALRTGDVLVYRRTREDSKKRADGHVVMVIDPDERIAWGSHAWDGERTGGQPDTGVEYQLIKTTKGHARYWDAWDSKAMVRVECWRHKDFIAEYEDPMNRPGSYDLSEVCSAAAKCGAAE